MTVVIAMQRCDGRPFSKKLSGTSTLYCGLRWPYARDRGARFLWWLDSHFFGGWIVMRHLCSVLLLLPARGASALPLTTDHAPPLALVSKYRVLTPDDCNGDAPKSFSTLCALWSGGILASQRYDKQGQGVAQTEEGGRRG